MTIEEIAETIARDLDARDDLFVDGPVTSHNNNVAAHFFFETGLSPEDGGGKLKITVERA